MPGEPRRVGLLRAVNLGSHNSVRMADLRAFLADLGLESPRTLLQSGNVVFGSRKSPAALESLLEAEARARLSLDTPFMVRTEDEWHALVDRNPFPSEAARAPGHLLAVLLKHTVGAVDVRKLTQTIAVQGGRERVQADGRHVYLVYPDGIGRSKCTTATIERALGARGTARNWNTVLKIQAVLAGTD